MQRCWSVQNEVDVLQIWNQSRFLQLSNMYGIGGLEEIDALG